MASFDYVNIILSPPIPIFIPHLPKHSSFEVWGWFTLYQIPDCTLVVLDQLDRCYPLQHSSCLRVSLSGPVVVLPRTLV